MCLTITINRLIILVTQIIPGFLDTFDIPPADLHTRFIVCSIVWSFGVPVNGLVDRLTVNHLLI